jgi:hypothetical protein
MIVVVTMMVVEQQKPVSAIVRFRRAVALWVLVIGVIICSRNWRE